MARATKTDEKKKKRNRGIRRTIEMIGAVTKKATTGRQRRGFKAEEEALKVAKYWQKKKVISAVRQTEGFGWEDMAMIDLVITLLDGELVPVQVKSYTNRQVIKDCQEKGVCFYFVTEDDEEEVARMRMLTDVIFPAYFLLLKTDPFQIRQLILKTLEMAQVPPPSGWFSLKRIFSR